MSVKHSLVPHLAWAIAARRGAQRWRAGHSSSDGLMQLYRPAVSFRQGSSKATARRTAQPLPPRPAAAVASSRIGSTSPSLPPIPPKPQASPNIPAPVQRETYNPNKDPKRFNGMFVATCIFGFSLSIYLAYLYTSYMRSLDSGHNRLPQDTDVSDRWHDATRDYDDEVSLSEKVMLLRAKRKRLIREAYGDVLEVSVGTGRNMDLYDTRPYSAAEDASYGRARRHMITSLTFNDQSGVMVERARRKWDAMQDGAHARDRFTGPVEFIVADAGRQDAIPRPRGGYDTIIQSMGLCSMADPMGFLQTLEKLVRQPGEEICNGSTKRMQQQQTDDDDGRGGRIFLLEHGRSYFDWLNRYLDATAPMHADHYGCWFNKDIESIVKESGLVVERVKRYYFGTTWEIILRPRVKAMTPASQDKNTQTAGKKVVESTSTSKPWWSIFWVQQV